MTTDDDRLRGFADYLLGKGYEAAPTALTMERYEWTSGWRLAQDFSDTQQECLDAGLIAMSEDGQSIWDPNEECETASQDP